LTKFNVAGSVVAVVKDGEIIHNKGYGVKSIETKEPVNQHTQFAIASNSKAFVTAGLAILVEEGKIVDSNSGAFVSNNLLGLEHNDDNSINPDIQFNVKQKYLVFSQSSIAAMHQKALNIFVMIYLF